MFLIRKSERKADQPYTLVLWHHGRMWNLPVRLREDKKYAAGSKKADESVSCMLPLPPIFKNDFIIFHIFYYM